MRQLLSFLYFLLSAGFVFGQSEFITTWDTYVPFESITIPMLGSDYIV